MTSGRHLLFTIAWPPRIKGEDYRAGAVSVPGVQSPFSVHPCIHAVPTFSKLQATSAHWQNAALWENLKKALQAASMLHPDRACVLFVLCIFQVPLTFYGLAKGGFPLPKHLKRDNWST